MPTERLSMRRIRDLLRLKHAQGRPPRAGEQSHLRRLPRPLRDRRPAGAALQAPRVSHEVATGSRPVTPVPTPLHGALPSAQSVACDAGAGTFVPWIEDYGAA